MIDPTPLRRTKMAAFEAYLRRRLPTPQRKTLIEIGSFCGASTLLWAELFEQVIAVDAWDVTLYHPKDPDAIRRKGQSHLNDAEQTFDAHMQKCPNVQKMKMTSAEAAVEWAKQPKPMVDCVYIDALHTYEGCLADIQRWRPFCRRLVMGHDYSSRWPGVQRAVNESFGRPDVTFFDTSWVHDVERARWGAITGMDTHELHQKIATLAHKNNESFSIKYHFETAQGHWHVHVHEDADNHEVFGGSGHTIELANHCCWQNALLSCSDYSWEVPPIFADEAEKLRAR